MTDRCQFEDGGNTEVIYSASDQHYDPWDEKKLQPWAEMHEAANSHCFGEFYCVCEVRQCSGLNSDSVQLYFSV